MFRPNSQLLTDSYKVSHWKQYPPKTKRVYSYLESRGGVFPETVFFGLLPKLRFLAEDLLWNSVERHAERIWAKHFGSDKIYNKEGWHKIMSLGYLPISIKAVPEGTVVPTGNVLMTIENTDDEFPWLTNWLETLLLQVWYPITVATQSREIKKLILTYLKLNGDPAGIPFKLHDFGFRGVSSLESAAVGGSAHLTSFSGTDTAIALDHVWYYYKGDECEGFSIPAAEHSTITAWGGPEHEVEACGNMLDQFPDGYVAVVSDSYDIDKACKHIWGELLRDRVLRRTGTVVVRPDSGYPPDIVLRCLEELGAAFGSSVNGKGFRVLDPHVRLIQGDGVDYDMIRNVLNEMHKQKWSADNVAFGMGGALLQKLNRDTQKMAIKCSAINIDGEWRDVSKNPVTDSGKKSKAGRLKLVKDGFDYKTVRLEEPGDDVMVEVFRDGRVLVEPTFAEVRERAKV